MEEKSNTMHYIIIIILLLLVICLLSYIAFFKGDDKKPEPKDNDIKEVEKKKEEEKPSEPAPEDIDLNDYVGVWQYFEGGENPEMEIIIKSVSDSTVNFDYVVYRIASFDGIEASLDKDIATFSTDEITGSISFEEGKIVLKTDKSSNGNIKPGTIEFTIKTNESALQ